MAAPAWLSNGTSAGGLGAVTPGTPSGLTATSLVLLFIETANEAVATPTGFTECPSSPQGTNGSGGSAQPVRLSIFYRIGTGAIPSLADPGNHQFAWAQAYSGVDTSNPFNTSSGSVKSTASTSTSIPGLTTTVNECLVIHAAANGIDTATDGQWSSISGPTELANRTTHLNENDASGNGGGILVRSGDITTAGSVGACTATLAASAEEAYICLALRPASAAQTLTPSLFTNSNSFFAPSVVQIVAPGLFTNTSSFFAPNVVQIVAPSLLSDGDTFFAPTVTVGAITLTPSLFTNTQTFYGPTITVGAVPLTPSLFTNSQTFHAPSVTVGAVTLSPSLFSNSQTFYDPTVSGGSVSLAPPLYTNDQTFYGPTVAVGGATLAPSLFTNTQTFHAPSISVGGVTLEPSLLANDNSFYSPTVTQDGAPQTLEPALLTNAQEFFSPTVARASQNLHGRRIRGRRVRYPDEIDEPILPPVEEPKLEPLPSLEPLRIAVAEAKQVVRQEVQRREVQQRAQLDLAIERYKVALAELQEAQERVRRIRMQEDEFFLMAA